MHRTPVQSSNIASVGFDREAGLLEVAYHNGAVYQYPGVSADLYAGLLQADSKGRYLHRHVLTPGHAYTKVDTTIPAADAAPPSA